MSDQASPASERQGEFADALGKFLAHVPAELHGELLSALERSESEVLRRDREQMITLLERMERVLTNLDESRRRVRWLEGIMPQFVECDHDKDDIVDLEIFTFRLAVCGKWPSDGEDKARLRFLAEALHGACMAVARGEISGWPIKVARERTIDLKAVLPKGYEPATRRY